jgi:hypothetical protein
MQLGERGHLARGHEPLGDRDLEAIEADDQHAWTSHESSV